MSSALDHLAATNASDAYVDVHSKRNSDRITNTYGNPFFDTLSHGRVL